MTVHVRDVFLSASDFSAAVISGGWLSLPLSTPIVYDGTSIVCEFSRMSSPASSRGDPKGAFATKESLTYLTVPINVPPQSRNISFSSPGSVSMLLSDSASDGTVRVLFWDALHSHSIATP